MGTPGHIYRFHLSAGRSSPAPSWTATSHWDYKRKNTNVREVTLEPMELQSTNIPPDSLRCSWLLAQHPIFQAEG